MIRDRSQLARELVSELLRVLPVRNYHGFLGPRCFPSDSPPVLHHTLRIIDL